MERSTKLPANYDPCSVPAPENADVIFYQDAMVPNLRLKVTRLSRTWVFDRFVNGKHLKRKIGNAAYIGLSEARMEAINLTRSIDLGQAPETFKEKVEKTVRSVATVKALFKDWNERHLIPDEVATQSEIERGYDKYWDFKSEPVSALTDDLVEDWKIRLGAEHGKHTANKQLTNLRACLNWNAARKKCPRPDDLFGGVTKISVTYSFTYLKKEQLADLRKALLPESQDIKDAIWLLLYTGARKSNVLGMEWKDIDWTHSTWTIPASASKNGRKTGKANVVELTPKTLEILNRRRGEHENFRFVFPSNGETGHLAHINKAWSGDKKAKKPGIRDRAGLSNLRLHDLRHTNATWLAQAGAQAYQIQKALNHSNIRTSQDYIDLAGVSVRLLQIRAQEEA